MSWRAAEAWHYERPVKAIGEGLVSVEDEGLGMKGSYKEIETWHPKESHLGKYTPTAARDSRILGMAVSWDSARTVAALECSQPLPRRQAMCASECRAGDVTQVLR